MNFVDGLMGAISGIKSYTQYTQNTQNSASEAGKGNFADIADFARKVSPEQPSSVSIVTTPSTAPDLPEHDPATGEFSTLHYLERWGAVFTLAGNDFAADLTAMPEEDQAGAERILTAPGRRASILKALRARDRAMWAQAASGVVQ